MPDLSFSQPPQLPLIELQSVDSTNNYARRLIAEGLTKGREAIFAESQSAGKGQRGRKWESQKGQNIILSLILDPFPLKVSEQFHMNGLVAVSCQDFFSKYAGPETKIKWPNDLYWQDRKAGGILIESIIQGKEGGSLARWKWAIIGLGININQTEFDETLPNPVSLRQITGKLHDPKKLAIELAEIIFKNFDELKEKGFKDFFKRYNDCLYKKNERARLKKENRVFDAIVRSVSTEGKLVVEHGIEEELEFGEVEWVGEG